MTARARIARRLRFLADRVDPHSGPRVMTAVRGFTFEEGLGVIFRDDGRGCPLWYMAQDYDRAHDEAGALDRGPAGRPGRAWVALDLLERAPWLVPATAPLANHPDPV